MKKPNDSPPPKYPGTPQAMDGTAAAVAMETAGSEAAGAYPITPATQMGEGWAATVASGKPNVFGRRLLFFEPEGEHAAAAVTAGMSLTGLRSANFSAGQGIAYMHESLYAAVGKRLTYVLHMACRAITKQALNIHCGHDDYHAVDDTGFFQLFAKNVQEVADLTLIAHRIAELSLNPGVCAQDGFLTSHVIETLRLPERELVAEYLGDPGDTIESPTPAQRMMFGDRRRRVPELFDLDHPAMLGVVQNQDAYAQGVAAQRPFFFDHVRELADRAFDEYAALTGRRYARATGYRSEDASYLAIGQGSVVYNLEEVCDHLRSAEGINVGVVNMTMFRPFPDDLVAALLRGKRAALVLERVDQPLAGDPPLLREIRGSVLKGLENGRAGDAPAPHPGLPAIAADEAPRLHSACYGLGSRDIQPGDLIAAIKNMLPDRARRSRFYLGVDFLRGRSGAAVVTRHQEALRQSYPGLEEIELPPEENVNLLPDDSLALRIHSVGGWGAITMGKNLALMLSDLIGFHVKANPKYGSEKKGQPTTFYAVLSRKPLRLNCDLKYVNVVLSPDPNVFRHSNALAGLAEGGVFVIQSDQSAEALWNGLPARARDTIRERNIEVFHLDAFAIARAEASDLELQYRMQGAAFQGALFAASPLMKREQLTEEALFEAIRSQLQKKFGHRGERVVEDNYRVIRRGFTEVCRLDWAALPVESAAPATTGTALRLPVVTPGEPGVGDPRRFFDQVCALYQSGQDPIADPFAALSAMPVATGAFRDMTGIRFEVPQFVAERCTGCGQCWTQCPDTAIPGLVSEIDKLLLTAASAAGDDGDACKQLPGIVSPLAEETRRVLKEVPETEFVDGLDMAYHRVVDRLELEPDQRKALDEELKTVSARLADFRLAKTAPFFDVPERETEGSGGLLSITVNPFACKGCNLCVEVCPDNALLAVKQDESIVEQLRDNWAFWQRLPDTPDRFVQIRDLDEGIGILHTMLLKKANYHAMVGGDGACMGCGEKTGIHLLVATIEAALQPHVSRFVARLNELISRLEDKVRLLLAADADLEHLSADGQVALAVSDEHRGQVARLTELLRRLKDLRWRYTTGPSGRGRSSLGMTNATGCSSVNARQSKASKNASCTAGSYASSSSSSARRTAAKASAILRACPSKMPIAIEGASWNKWLTQGKGYGL
jgi:pyruvate-ferredoxin/flavodoxin oxidoreductase